MGLIHIKWIEMRRLFLKKISDKVRFLDETGYQATKSVNLFRNTLGKTNFKTTDKIVSIPAAAMAQWASDHAKIRFLADF